MKVAFLDRDGVINKEINYLYKIADFEYTYRCIDGLRILTGLGFKLVIVTNQAGIAKGIFTQEQYRLLATWMLSDLKNHGVDILECSYCPHHPNGKIEEYSVECKYRKPGTGMLDAIKISYNVDMDNSILIGDKITDIQAANDAGVGRAFLVKSGHPQKPDLFQDHKFELADNLYSVARYLEKKS